jgi:anti-sigma factor RsiW
MSCEQRELLSPYLDDRLPPAEARRVAEHLETCARCRQELAEMRMVSEVIWSLSAARLPTDLAPVVVTRAAGGRWREWWAALAGFLVPRRRMLARAAAVAALFALALPGSARQLGAALIAWPSQVAMGACTAVNYVSTGLAHAQTFLDHPASSPADQPPEPPEGQGGLLTPGRWDSLARWAPAPLEARSA